MKVGQSVAMLLFTGVSTIGVASGAGYRIAAVCAAVLCGIGGIVFAFYNERKVLNLIHGLRRHSHLADPRGKTRKTSCNCEF